MGVGGLGVVFEEATGAKDGVGPHPEIPGNRVGDHDASLTRLMMRDDEQAGTRRCRMKGNGWHVLTCTESSLSCHGKGDR